MTEEKYGETERYEMKRMRAKHQNVRMLNEDPRAHEQNGMADWNGLWKSALSVLLLLLYNTVILSKNILISPVLRSQPATTTSKKKLYNIQ